MTTNRDPIARATSTSGAAAFTSPTDTVHPANVPAAQRHTSRSVRSSGGKPLRSAACATPVIQHHRHHGVHHTGIRLAQALPERQRCAKDTGGRARAVAVRADCRIAA